MMDTTKEIIERHYGKIYLLAIIVIFTVIMVLGIWGFFDAGKTNIRPNANQPITAPARK